MRRTETLRAAVKAEVRRQMSGRPSGHRASEAATTDQAIKSGIQSMIRNLDDMTRMLGRMKDSWGDVIDDLEQTDFDTATWLRNVWTALDGAEQELKVAKSKALKGR